MSKIKVLVVDDSVVFRSVIRGALDGLEDIEVIGTASNGRIALDKLKLIPTDLIILDLEMPELDGIGVLKELKNIPVKPKVLLFSSLTQRGAAITLEALKLGASDFVTKPDALTAGDPQEKIKQLLLPKVRAIFHRSVIPEVTKVEKPVANAGHKVFNSSLFDLMKPKIITIGSSTGGPSVLEFIFQNLRGPLKCPIVIVQHMPPLFTASLAQRIQNITGISCAEAKDGEVLENKIYIAPGDFHLRLEQSDSKVYLRLSQDDFINFVRPAVDPLFQTASAIFKEGCLGIILTGMGQDGKVGTSYIKNNGGAVVIQNEETCVVFGMPGAVKAQGSYDFIKTPTEISAMLKAKAAL